MRGYIIMYITWIWEVSCRFSFISDGDTFREFAYNRAVSYL